MQKVSEFLYIGTVVVQHSIRMAKNNAHIPESMSERPIEQNGGKDSMRQAILEVAAEKMRKAGIRSVSIDDICRDLGMSKKTFYAYFDSKDQLVQEMLALHEQQMVRKMLREVEGKSTLQILREWDARARLRRKDLEQPPPIMYDLMKYYPALGIQHKERLCEQMYRNLVRFINKGKAEGIFRAEIDADLTAQLFAYSHHLFIEQIERFPKRREEIIGIARQGWDILLAGILTDEHLKDFPKHQNNKPVD